MMKKISIITMISLMMLLVLAGCSPKASEGPEISQADVDLLNSKIQNLEDEKASLEKALETSELDNDVLSQELELLKSSASNASNPLLTASLNVLAALDAKDMNALATYTHATQGIRFSPYAYVDTSTDLVFQSTALGALLNDTTLYTWGSFDGSGEPISLTFDDYFDDFVYDEDYLNPHIIGINQVIGQGNTLVNLSTVYPNAEFVEFHFTGFDAQYQGIDWSSLILVFENTSSGYKLIGIVHHQWTI